MDSEKTYTSVSTASLKPGMVVAKDVYNGDTKLLNINSPLTIPVIKKIQYYFPQGFIDVLTYSLNPDQQNVEPSTGARTLQATEETFSKISSDVELMMNSITNNSKPSIKIVREISNSILDNIVEYSLALKSITLQRDMDEYLVRHCTNVAILSTMLGKWLNLSHKEITMLNYAGLLHDIGKTKLDSQILDKPGELTRKEFAEVKKHPIYSYNIVSEFPFLDDSIAQSVLMHHERIDGSGYPLGLTGDKIHKFAKIIAIADVFDAMTSNKSYKSRKNPFEALKIMESDFISKLDVIYLKTFIEKMTTYYTGEMVILNNNDVAKIIKMDPNNIDRPLVMVNDTFIDLKVNREYSISDLSHGYVL
ncbi:HD-GYP domain, c-di-GMP phosphodiesterase class II (or its inactivated variant) [Hathewaya proteolytica DSM 3090]|uniref:HD-GYP domain, c-di-GMP phosphodiesterase class II (Or its inactivated variant) n=1 Tax=Hathewaya proteolytica DSM 3090 TaxID=1121331 RepID=A0A1M6RTX9_9CLOT|nr:HD-GYP domain-containing protein [Hathewaya proteolytica]SHK35899.1 HD-GYP domain, c-di-GMP phosphodiesterase class II (or its inactivated variant) [Hathewaya proteolytica DSM 3090]